MPELAARRPLVATAALALSVALVSQAGVGLSSPAEAAAAIADTLGAHGHAVDDLRGHPQVEACPGAHLYRVASSRNSRMTTSPTGAAPAPR